MADVPHGSLQPGASSGIHPIHHWAVTSEAARTGLSVAATDVGKVCRQIVGADVSWWVLSSQSGGVGQWVRLDSADAGASTPLAPTNTGTGTTAIATASNTGTSVNAARQDHTHAHGAQTNPTMHAVASAAAAGFMSAADKEKLDGMSGGANTPLATANTGSGTTAIATASNTGSSTNAARQDHTHAHGAQTDPTMHAVAVAHTATPVGGVNTTGGSHGFMSADAAAKLATVAIGATVGPSLTNTAPAAVTKSTAVPGVANDAARIDHKHDVSTATPVSVTPGVVAAEGVATSLARSDHVHLLPAAAPNGLSANQLTAVEGAALTVARSDHAHSVPTATPVAVGTSNSTGTSASLARADHIHDASHLAPKLYEFVTNNAASLTLSLAHLGKCILCTYTAGSPIVTIPRDSTLNLPVGFNCQLLGDVTGVSTEWNIAIVSEVMTGTIGTPARYPESGSYSSTSATPYTTVATLLKLVTLIKIGADRWLVAGHHVPAA